MKNDGFREVQNFNFKPNFSKILIQDHWHFLFFEWALRDLCISQNFLGLLGKFSKIFQINCFAVFRKLLQHSFLQISTCRSFFGMISSEIPTIFRERMKWEKQIFVIFTKFQFEIEFFDYYGSDTSMLYVSNYVVWIYILQFFEDF